MRCSLLVLLFLTASWPLYAQVRDSIPDFATKVLDSQYRRWSLQENFGDNVAVGDFDGDERQDIAVHIQYGEPAESVWSTPQDILVIFDRSTGPVLYHVSKADALFNIYTVAGGGVFCDLYAEEDNLHTEDGCVTINTDALGVGYEEKTSSLLYWDGNKFKSILTGD